MPIEKFATFSEADQALWSFEQDEAYYKRVAELWKLANCLCPLNFPRGIYKYKTIEEANKQKQEWLLNNALKKTTGPGMEKK
jgi:hypothetical protein